MGAGASATQSKGASLHPSLFGMNPVVNCKLLVIGLDNSGKTSVISYMRRIGNKKSKGTKAEAEVVPTIGFHLEEFTKGSFNFTMYDMSGQSRYRELWQNYYHNADGVVFVLDCTDKIRMCVAKNELDMLLAHNDVKRRNIPFLFYVNKMDLPGAMDPVEVKDLLDLGRLKEKPWHLTHSNAKTGFGVEEGLTWLTTLVAENPSRDLR